MAEVDPSHIPHADGQTQGADNLEMGLEHGLDKNLGENIEQHLEQGLVENLEQTLEPNLVQIAEQNFAQDLEQSLEQELDQSLDQNGDQNPEQSAEQDLQQNSQQDIEYQQKQEHGDDTVAEGTEKKWPGWPGDSVFRMLVPAQKVGSIIGRKGEFIKKIVEETRARVKILDGPPGTTERAVMVSAKEEPDSSLPPAIDGLLRVHKRVIDGLDSDGSNAATAPGSKVSTRLLVPASQAGSLIGKQGATVKTIQETSCCVVRVLASEEVPNFALQDDRVVEVVGDPAGVHKAVELIASHLRKFLVDHSIISVFEMQMQMTNQRMDHLPHHGPPHQSWGPPQGAYGGSGFVNNPQYMPPPRQLDNYYPLPDMAISMEKQPHQGISAYGREAPISVPSAAQTAPSMVTQVTKQMQIPLSCADAVIGTAGANISYIRRASGATVTIQESRGAPGEMTVEISGAGSQVQAAEQLIQNFIVDAGGSAQPQTGGSADQGYNPYAAPHGSVYASPAPNPGHAGSYNVYGSNYGY